MIAQAVRRFGVATRGPGFTEITVEVRAWAETFGGDGLLTLHVMHTSCSLTVQENADGDVRADLMDAFDRLAPRDAGYRHGCEGPDDMPAHIRTALTDTSLSIPMIEGRLMLGTWQGIYLIEHRDRPHRRTVAAHLSYGESA